MFLPCQLELAQDQVFNSAMYRSAGPQSMLDVSRPESNCRKSQCEGLFSGSPDFLGRWPPFFGECASMRLISSGTHPRTERTKQRLSQIPFLVLLQGWIEFKMVGRLAHLDVLVEDPAHLASELF